MVYAPQSHRKSRPAPGILDGAVDLARDKELVELCQAGDDSAFSELYTRYCRRLHRFCLRRLHDSDDADEAVQEAFTRAWRALATFGGERRFYPWLTVIAGNVCTDMLRRRSRVVPMDDIPLRPIDLGQAEIDEQLLRQVDVAMASAALEQLSDRHRRVLHLREESGWSAQRIAEHEGVAVPAVDTLLWRARQAFKREFSALAETGGGLAAVLGVGLATWRRALARGAARVASVLPAPARGPGALAASVVLAGAAVTGGGIALVGSGPHARAPSGVASAAASALVPSGTSASTASFLGTSYGSSANGSSGAGSQGTAGSRALSTPSTPSGGDGAASTPVSSPGTPSVTLPTRGAAGALSSLVTPVTNPASGGSLLSGAAGLATDGGTSSVQTPTSVSTALGAVTAAGATALTAAHTAVAGVTSTVRSTVGSVLGG